MILFFYFTQLLIYSLKIHRYLNKIIAYNNQHCNILIWIYKKNIVNAKNNYGLTIFYISCLDFNRLNEKSIQFLNAIQYIWIFLKIISTYSYCFHCFFSRHVSVLHKVSDECDFFFFSISSRFRSFGLCVFSFSFCVSGNS